MIDRQIYIGRFFPQLVLAVLLPWGVAVAQGGEGDIRTYISRSSGFGVVFPPGLSAPMELDYSDHGFDARMVMATGENRVATVFSAQYPGDMFATAPAQQLLGDSRDRLLRLFNGTLVREEPLPGGGTGRRVFFRTETGAEGQGWGRADMMLSEPRFYQVLYIGQTEESLATDAVVAYFDSFRLLEAGSSVYESQQAGLRIEFPDGYYPDQSTELADTPVGNLPVTTALATTDNGVALVSFARYPDGTNAGDDATALIDGLRDAFIGSKGGMVARQQPIEHDGHPGRSIYFSGRGPNDVEAWGRLDVVLADEYFYQILYVSDSQDDLNDPRIRAFFDSFTITSSNTAQ